MSSSLSSSSLSSSSVSSSSASSASRSASAATALSRLRQVLLANAVSSSVGGAIALFAGPWVSEQLGIDHVTTTRLIGAGLLGFAAFVAWVARAEEHHLIRESLVISLGDAGWVVASVVVVLTGILTTTGVVVALLLAALVGDLGATQYWLRRKALTDPAATAQGASLS